MKLTALLFLITTLCFAQEQIIKGKYSLHNVTNVPVVEGSVLKYELPRDSAKVFNLKSEGSQIWDVEITAKKRVIDTPPPTIIKVDNKSATTTTDWFNGDTAAPGWYQNSMAYTNTTGGVATYQFTGTKIAAYGETAPKHGITAFSIDGGAEVTFNQYSASVKLPVLLYASPTLSRGVHTLRIRCTGLKAAASTDKFSIFDYLEVTP